MADPQTIAAIALVGLPTWIGALKSAGEIVSGARRKAVDTLGEGARLERARETIAADERQTNLDALAAIAPALTTIATIAPQVVELVGFTKEILAEVKPNHGGSLKDAITRTEGVVTSLVEDMGVVHTRLGDIEAKQGRDHDQIQSLAGLVADVIEEKTA